MNLAVTVGKPIIPLLLEQMTWPPAGAMGPIFSEYLYVKFYQREQAKDDRFWPADKFQELLVQLRYHIAPDPSLITDGAKLFSLRLVVLSLIFNFQFFSIEFSVLTM